MCIYTMSMTLNRNLYALTTPIPDSISISFHINSLFVFFILFVLGLYYFVSGVFGAAEQLIVNVIEVRNRRKLSMA